MDVREPGIYNIQTASRISTYCTGREDLPTPALTRFESTVLHVPVLTPPQLWGSPFSLDAMQVARGMRLPFAWKLGPGAAHSDLGKQQSSQHRYSRAACHWFLEEDGSVQFVVRWPSSRTKPSMDPLGAKAETPRAHLQAHLANTTFALRCSSGWLAGWLSMNHANRRPVSFHHLPLDGEDPRYSRLL